MNYWEEILENSQAVRFGVSVAEVISFKKCVNPDYGQIWFEVALTDGRILTSNMPGH